MKRKVLILVLALCFAGSVSAVSDGIGECNLGGYFNETSGPSIDYCNGYDFVWNGDPQSVTSGNGINDNLGLDFDGNDYLMSENSENILQSNNNFTISAWINPDSVGSQQRVIASTYYNNQFGSTNNGGLVFYVESNSKVKSFYYIDQSGNANEIIGSSSVSPDNLYHVVLRKNSSSADIVINNSLETSVSASDPVVGGNDISVGARNFSGTFEWYNDGMIDELRVYDDYLNNSQVTKVYNGDYIRSSAAPKILLNSPANGTTFDKGENILFNSTPTCFSENGCDSLSLYTNESEYTTTGLETVVDFNLYDKYGWQNRMHVMYDDFVSEAGNEYGFFQQNKYGDDSVKVLYENGTEVWSQDTSISNGQEHHGSSTVASGDMDGDGYAEVMNGISTSNGGGDPTDDTEQGGLQLLDNDGSKEWLKRDYHSFETGTVCDFNDDGVDEIVGAWAKTENHNKGVIVSYDFDGNVLLNRTVGEGDSGKWSDHSGLDMDSACIDLDYNGTPEFLVGGGNGDAFRVIEYDGSDNGNLKFSVNYGSGMHGDDIFASDFDGDGAREVAVLSGEESFGVYNSDGSTVFKKSNFGDHLQWIKMYRNTQSSEGFVYISEKDGSNIYKLDATGNQVWSKDLGDSGNFGVKDLNNDGYGNIIADNSDNEVVVYNASGAELVTGGEATFHVDGGGRFSEVSQGDELNIDGTRTIWSEIGYEESESKFKAYELTSDNWTKQESVSNVSNETEESILHRFNEKGDYKWNIKVAQSDGQTSFADQNRTLTIKEEEDTISPSINIDSPQNQTYSTSSIDLNVTSNEPVETWQYSLDGGSNQTFTPNTTLTGLTEGSHNLNVYATDSEGNTGEASASFVVDINEAPKASFSFSPSDPVVDETISFDASGSSDSDGSIVSYEWDWTNDGTFEDSGQTASHTYGSSSNFNAVLRVTDDEGATDTVSNVVEVGSGSVDNPAPEVILALNATDIVVGDSVLANVSASDDGNISMLELDWEGDGVYDESGFVNEFNATNTFNESGIYSVTARAEDDEGKETLESVTVNVDNVRTSTNKSIISSCENSTSSDGFCLENRSDETSIQGFTNDDSYTFEASVDVINSIVGEFTLFGFVNTTSGRNDGVESGKVNVTVSDESSVVNDPPTAEYSISPTDPTPGESISFDGSLSSDPDGSIVSYEWDWTNDGTIDDTGVNPSHSYGSEGDYTARLVVTDDEGATSTYTNTVPVQSESSDGGGGGGDDGSDDGGGSIGDPDDGDSTNEASADGSSVNLVSPKSQTKFVGSSIALDESASDDTTVTIGGNDNTFKLVETIDGNTAKIDVSGQNYTLDIGEELPLNFGVNDASRVYLSSVTDTEDVGEVSLNIYGTGYFADDTASPYYSYNYSLDGAADVSLLIKNTEDSSFTEVDSFSSNSAVNGTQTFVGNESSGIYEAKLELNTENSTVETDKVGFYLGKVPVINILRPSNGVTIERPAAQGNVSAPLDFEFRLANNVSSNISTYYESVDTGQRFDGNIESVDVRNREDGILETFVRKGLNLAFSWTDKIQFEPDVDVQGNSSVYISEKGGFDGFVNVSVFGEDNSLSARSVPISVDVVGLDLSNESERRDYFDSRDGDSDQSFVQSPGVNESVGDNSSVRYFDSRFAVFEPDPGTRFEVRDLENFDVGIDFDFVVNASDSSEVNRSLFVESVNGSTVVERELNPLQAQQFETLDETDFNGSWSEGEYRVYGKTFYENGSVLQTVDPDHSFYVEDATPGLIQYTFGSVVEALTTVYDFTSERAGLLIALFGVGGWYAGFKSRNYDFLARWGAVGLIAFFSGWIPGGPVYIPGSIQAVVLTVGAATLTLKFLRGDITL